MGLKLGYLTNQDILCVLIRETICVLIIYYEQFNTFSFTGESGVVYRGYFNTREGKELVAIKTCKRKYVVVSGKALIYSAYDNYSNNLARVVAIGQI